MQNLSIFQMILDAGPMVKFVMLLLLIFSLVSWTIIIMKHLSYKNARAESAFFLDTFWKSNRASKAGAEDTLEMKLAGMDNLKRALRKAENTQLARLGRYLSFLATTGSATPFIGLFGTVWGIMTSFQDIGMRGSASLAVVAPGISEALVATAAGLAVAIPSVIFYNYYSNKLAELENDMQSFSADFLNLVERDLLSRI